MVKLSLPVVVLDLQVRQGCVTAGTPVDDVIALVDQPLIVQPYKDLPDRLRQPLVHGEPFSLPITGGTQAVELLENHTTVLLPPLPHLLHELFAAQGVAVGPLGVQLLLDNVLGGDPGMVCSRHPECFAPVHTLVPDQHILERVVKCMSHVKGAGDVGWRYDDTVRRSVGAFICVEVPIFHPEGVPLFLG